MTCTLYTLRTHAGTQADVSAAQQAQLLRGLRLPHTLISGYSQIHSAYTHMYNTHIVHTPGAAGAADLMLQLLPGVRKHTQKNAAPLDLPIGLPLT